MHNFNSPFEMIFLGLGASPIAPRVVEAMTYPTRNAVDAKFLSHTQEVQTLLRDLLKTKNRLTFPLLGTGSLGMEATLMNTLEPNDVVLVIEAGILGKRISDVAKRLNANLVSYEIPIGSIISENQLEELLKKHSPKLVVMVHGEISTGVLQPLDKFGKLIHKYNSLFAVDCGATLGGTELNVDEWDIDIVFGASQYCLAAPVGLAPISVSNRCFTKIKNRRRPTPSRFLDFVLLNHYWNESKQIHSSSPTHLIYAFREALLMHFEEGHENVINRHSECHKILVDGIKKLHLPMLVDDDKQLPQLTTIGIPPHLSVIDLKLKLLKEFNIEVSIGTGPFGESILKIGLLGRSAYRPNVLFALSALKQCLTDLNYFKLINLNSQIA